jgi:L-cysteine S-thiosulfotransferase
MSWLLAMALVAVVGDGLPTPLTNVSGDANRGRAIVANRQQSLCLLCHSGPFTEPHLQGNIASNLAGAGSRWSAAQLRLRIVDAKQINPTSVMPAMHKVDELTSVGRAWRDKPVLDAQQVEDVVAFLQTLRD